MVVGRMLGAAALGIYSRAYDIMVIPTNALGRVLVRVLFPSLSRLQHDVAQLRTAYRRALALVSLLVMPVSALTIVLAPEIVATLLGPKWGAAVLPLRVLAAAMYFQVSHKVAEGVANAMGAVYRTAWRSALYAFLVLAGAVLGQRWGLVGVATGVVVAIAVNFAMLTHLSATLTHLSRGELARVHLPGFAWSASVAAAAALIATMLRGAGSAPVVTLVLSAGVPLIAAVIVLRLLSLRLLGPDGVWLVHTLGDHAPAPLRPVLGVLLGAYRRG
jgi:PST family polysaccharide transporter